MLPSASRCYYVRRRFRTNLLPAATIAAKEIPAPGAVETDGEGAGQKPAKGVPYMGVNAGEDVAARRQNPTVRGTGMPRAQSGAIGNEDEKLLLEHLPIVRFLARRIHERLPQHVDMEDLVAAGVVGLMDALSKFDPKKKVQFRSYAQFRIRGAILDSLRTLDWSPRELRRKARAAEEAIHALTARLQRVPSATEIAQEMGLTLKAYQSLLCDLKGLEVGTLHVEHSAQSGEEELAYVPSLPEDDPLFICLRGELQERLAGAIDRLPERERLVMTLYYYEEMTMKEISLALGVVESRISQIHSSAVLHLRTDLKELAGKGRILPGTHAEAS